jgi:hypothetical protein
VHGARELDGGLGGLASAGDEEEARVLHGGAARHLPRQGFYRRRGELRAMDIGEPARLLAGGVGDLGHTVPDRYDEGAPGSVDVPAAVAVEEIHAFASDDLGVGGAGVAAEDGGSVQGLAPRGGRW